jgi:hypothetical protein
MEICLIRNNMSRNDNFVGGEIKTGSLCDQRSIRGKHIWWTWVPVYKQLWRRDWDSTCKCSYEGATSWMATLGLVTLIALLGRRFSLYVVVWSAST